MWNFTGQTRPDFAVDPAPGQESVWDYPRPPIAEPSDRVVKIRYQDIVLARSEECYRLKETASPPTYYIPGSSVDWHQLVEVPGQSFCEWKGAARYWGLKSDPRTAVAWAYPEPTKSFAMLAGYVSFYPGRVACFVDGERVRPQAGGFYGGWITDDVVGPFKGTPGTAHW